MKKIYIGLLLIIIIFLLTISYSRKENKLNIYFFNAGSADSILIYNSKYAVLIDTGEEDLSKDILKYLKQKNIKKLDYLIITHFDKDHVGSASKLIDNIKIDNVLQSNSIKSSKVYNKYIESLSNNNISVKTIRENLIFNLNDLEFEIIPPELEEYDIKPSNNSSLIVSLKYKNNSFIFTGDIENTRIDEYVSKYNDVYDLIKIPYHGNYQSNLNKLLDTIKPKYAIITNKKEDTKTLKLLEESDIKTYITGNGSILVTSDGNNISIKQ